VALTNPDPAGCRFCTAPLPHIFVDSRDVPSEPVAPRRERTLL